MFVGDRIPLSSDTSETVSRRLCTNRIWFRDIVLSIQNVFGELISNLVAVITVIKI